MKNRKVFWVMSAIIIVVLLLPMAQGEFKIFSFEPLQGAFYKTPKPNLTFDNVTNGSYQTNIEKYISENYGFRQPMIRFYNQYLWDFYKKTNAQDVVRGKDGWLFSNKQVEKYYGTFQHRYFNSNAAAKNSYDINIRTLNKLRHVLKKLDIELLVYISPNKCYIFPEFIPEREHDTTTINVCAYYVDNFKELGIPCLEMTGMFRHFRDTMQFEPFSKYGAHWNFSSVYSADSLFRFIESINGINLPDIKISNYRKYDKAAYKKNLGDFDYEWMMNLMREFDHSKCIMYEGDVEIVADSTHVKPSVLFVGNSFLMHITDYINFGDVFENPRLWYYNQTAYNLTDLSKRPVNELDFLDEVLKSDYIVTFCSDIQLFEISFGFAGKTLVSLCIPDSIYMEKIDYLCKSQGVSKEKAIYIINTNPFVFDELKGDGIPEIRNEAALEKINRKRACRNQQEALSHEGRGRFRE